MSKKQTFGDIVYDDNLVKRTIMVSAFPALIKEVKKDGESVFEGFLPGFEFAEIKDMTDEFECVEYLQDMLDDEVEELVVFGKSLPNVDEDNILMQKYPDYKIVYLDINVYVDKHSVCSDDCHNCESCGTGHCQHDHDCDCDDHDCDCCDCDCDEHDHDCDCDCDCDCEHEDCDCNYYNCDDYDCEDDYDDGDDDDCDDDDDDDEDDGCDYDCEDDYDDDEDDDYDDDCCM